MRVNRTVLRFAAADGADVVSALPASGTAVAGVGPSIAILGARGGAIGAHIDGPSVSEEPSGPSNSNTASGYDTFNCHTSTVGTTGSGSLVTGLVRTQAPLIGADLRSRSIEWLTTA